MATFFLLLIYLAFISLGLPDSLLGSAWPEMHQELNSPLGLAGLLSMTITVGTIVSSLFSGPIINRFGTGKVTLVSCMLTAGALVGFSFAPSVAWLVVFAIPLGVGGGAVDAGLNNYVAAHYKAHHMSWLHCFWGVGATLGPIIMAQSMMSGSWREGYSSVAYIQLGLVVLLLITLPLWRLMELRYHRSSEPELTDSIQPEEGSDKTIRPLKIKGVKLALMTFLFYCGVESTLGLWGSSYLVSTKGLPADQAAHWLSLYFAGITIGRFITGFITFKFSNRDLIRGGQWLAVAGTLLMILPLPPLFSLAGFMIVGLGLAPIFPCMLHETPVRFGKSQSQTIMGYQMAVAYTGSTLMPPLFGLLASNISMKLLPLYLFLMAAAMFLFSEKLNSYMRKRAAA
ncbi:Fucose permease [Paenibacillaceae bacterium GAS479]|nr:Fucose permease [Paenibacillaceae bacterium GAS479]